MMNYSGPDKKNSGSSFDNQDFGIYGRGYEGYAHYMQAVKESGSSISVSASSAQSNFFFIAHRVPFAFSPSIAQFGNQHKRAMTKAPAKQELS